MVLQVAEDAMRYGTYDEEIFASARELCAHRSMSFGVKKRLGDLLDLIEEGCDCSSAINARVMAFGIELHELGQYVLAIDVFATVCEHAAKNDPRLRVQAIHKRAYSLRSIPDPDEAELAYHALVVAAKEIGDTHMELEGRLGLVKVLMTRGNHQAALPRLDAILKAAQEDDDTFIIGKALLDRAYIAGSGHDEDAAMHYTQEARRVLPDGPERDRCGVTLAVASRERGHHEAARDYAEDVVACATDLEERVKARFVLYHLAIDARDRGEQDRHHTWLETASLTDSLRVEYHNVVARDQANELDFDAASDSLRKMLDLAETSGLHEDVVRAEKAMWHVARRVVPTWYKYRPARRTPTSDAAAVNGLATTAGHDVARTTPTIPIGIRVIAAGG